MAATVWKGHLTFGLISIPVRLFSAARSERLSVAPVPMVGITGMFPNTSRVTFSIGCMISGSSGDGFASLMRGGADTVTVLVSPPNALIRPARTSAGL